MCVHSLTRKQTYRREDPFSIAPRYVPGGDCIDLLEADLLKWSLPFILSWMLMAGAGAIAARTLGGKDWQRC